MRVPGGASLVLLIGLSALGWVVPQPLSSELRAQIKPSVDRGLRFLFSQQEENGSWRDDPGLTGLVVKAFAESPRQYNEQDGPFLRKSVRFLISSVMEPFHWSQTGYRSMAQLVLGLESLRNPAYLGRIADLRAFLGRAAVEDLEEPKLESLVLVLRALGHSRTVWPIWADAGEALVDLPADGSPGQGAARPVLKLLRLRGLRLAGRSGEIPTSAEVGALSGREGVLIHHRFYILAQLLSAGDLPGLNREDLVRAIMARQSQGPMGRWVNESGLWGEEDPVLATCLAILGLEELSGP